MNLRPEIDEDIPRSIPRESGDEPKTAFMYDGVLRYSPRERG